MSDQAPARLIVWDGLTGTAPTGEVYAITSEPDEDNPGRLRHTIECVSERSGSVTSWSQADGAALSQESLKDEAEPWAAAKMILAGREPELTPGQLQAGIEYLHEETSEAIEIVDGRIPLSPNRSSEEAEARLAEIAAEVAAGRAALARHGCQV